MKTIIALAASLLITAGVATAEPLTLEDVSVLRQVTTVRMSPTGDRIAYLLQVPREVYVDADGSAFHELHVTDLEGCGAALFIDASVEVDEGYRLERIGPSRDGNFSTHAISPQALLNVFEQTMKPPAPDAWLLHVAAREFELGAEPGNDARQAIEQAHGFLRQLLGGAPSGWREGSPRSRTPTCRPRRTAR